MKESSASAFWLIQARQRSPPRTFSSAPGLFLLFGSFALGGQRTRLLGFRHCIVVRIVSVTGLLEVLLQFFLRLPAALTYGPHLLRCRRGVGVLVRAVLLRAVSDFLTHTEIVPPRVSVGKTPLHVQPNDMSNRTTAGGPACVRLSLAHRGLPGSGVASTGGRNPEAD